MVEVEAEAVGLAGKDNMRCQPETNLHHYDTGLG